MNSRTLRLQTQQAAGRAPLAAALTVSGYIHAQLYLDGYRFVHAIGVMFLLQSSASFAIALLLLVANDQALLRVAAAGLAFGALAGFAASRTIGVFGFTEHGLQPAPQALVSVIAEVVVLLLLAAQAALFLRSRP